MAESWDDQRSRLQLMVSIRNTSTTRERYLLAEIERLEGELEQKRVQLAGCSVAALGYTSDPAKQGDYGWSVAYQDVLDLRLKYEASLVSVKELEKKNQRQCRVVEDSALV